MLYWLIVIILAYFFFSISFLGDKLMLSGSKRAKTAKKETDILHIKPKTYTFFVGLWGIVVVFVIPFIHFGFPGPVALGWILLEAITYILGLYFMFIAIEMFEVSRVMATIGGLQPIFILLLTLIFFGPQPITPLSFLAFVLLLIGSVAISLEKKITMNRQYLLLSVFSALLFSLSYVFSKLVFLHQPFLQGVIWINIATFLFAVLLLFDKGLRKHLRAQKGSAKKEMGIVFFLTQLTGGVANLLQGFAISLVPVGYLAIVSSLRGMQYVFLFLMTLFFSVLFPKILKEETSHKVIGQKIVSIVLICIGLYLLVI